MSTAESRAPAQRGDEVGGPGERPTRRKLTARVIDSLRQGIEDGDLAPGDRLPTEPELIERFGVSRTVIREAIAELRANGFVESRQGVGVFVKEPLSSPVVLNVPPHAVGRISDTIEDLEFRAAIEIEAAGLAAQRASPAQEAEIEARHFDFVRGVRRGESNAEADLDFHLAIARATNNARFETFLSQLGRRTFPRDRLRVIVGPPSGTDTEEAVINEHYAILEAIERRDPTAAREAMRSHLAAALQRYRVLVRGAGVREAEASIDTASARNV